MKNSATAFATLSAALFGFILSDQGNNGQGQGKGRPGLTPEQEEILSHLSIEYLPGGASESPSVTYKTIRITGVNVQVVSGSGATYGPTNGLGNLIVGYNEQRDEYAPLPERRTGSHNLIVGDQHGYESYGSIVSGFQNTVLSTYSAAIAGYQNYVMGHRAAAIGGVYNIAGGSYAVTVGAGDSRAQGAGSVVVGGVENASHGRYSACVGGEYSEAGGHFAVAVGGGSMNAREDHSVNVAGSLFPEN